MGVDPKVTPLLCIFVLSVMENRNANAKIKVTFVPEIVVSLRYVMYMHMICETKGNKDRESPFI